MAANIEYRPPSKETSRFKIWVLLANKQTREFFSFDRVVDGTRTDYGRRRLEKWIPQSSEWRDPVEKCFIYDRERNPVTGELIRVYDNGWRDATPGERGRN